MIKLPDMIRQLQKPERHGSTRFVAVSLVYATADRRRGSGGQIRELHRARLTSLNYPKRLALLQPVGTRDTVAIHLDLILYLNQQEVV